MKAISIIIGLFLSLTIVSSLYAENALEPLKNAKSVIMRGPNVSGMAPYGLAIVKTHNGECFQYTTDKGQFIKYKKCEDETWIDIHHDFIQK